MGYLDDPRQSRSMDNRSSRDRIAQAVMGQGNPPMGGGAPPPGPMLPGGAQLVASFPGPMGGMKKGNPYAGMGHKAAQEARRSAASGGGAFGTGLPPGWGGMPPPGTRPPGVPQLGGMPGMPPPTGGPMPMPPGGGGGGAMGGSKSAGVMPPPAAGGQPPVGQDIANTFLNGGGTPPVQP